jgi:hypothetical protein
MAFERDAPKAARPSTLRWPRRKNEKAKNNGAGMVASKREPGNNKVNQLRETFLSYAEAKKMFSVQASKVRGSISVAEPSLSKNPVGLGGAQGAKFFSKVGGQQGAQADAGYSASCFLLSCARRGLACRWPRRKNEKAKNNGAGMEVSKRETRKASK